VQECQCRRSASGTARSPASSAAQPLYVVGYVHREQPCAPSSARRARRSAAAKRTWMSARVKLRLSSSKASCNSPASIAPLPSASISSKHVFSCAFCSSLSFGRVDCARAVGLGTHDTWRRGPRQVLRARVARSCAQS
jgi:hypothetical protein